MADLKFKNVNCKATATVRSHHFLKRWPSKSHNMYSSTLCRLLATSLAVAQLVSCESPITVQITNGTVTGLFDAENKINKWLGIPYAQQPVGNLRLTQARPLNSTFGELKATDFGFSCHGRGNPNSDEACLTLNIWRPSSAPQNLPVLVWIYGGGLR